MRWPLIFRATHDELIHAERRERTRECERAEYWQKLYESAMMRHTEFVATLADRTLPAAKPVPLVTPPRVPDAADGAVELAAAFDPRRRRALAQHVRARRAAGAKAEDIAQEILHPPQDGDGQWEMPE